MMRGDYSGKQAVVDNVSANVGVTRRVAEKVIDEFIKDVTAKLRHSDGVRIPGFGIFMAEVRPARKGRNPSTGEAMTIPAKRVVRFRPFTALADAVSRKRGGAGEGGDAD